MSLKNDVCALGNHAGLSAAEVLARRADFDCSKSSLADPANHYWVMVEFPDEAKDMQAPVWRIRMARYGDMAASILYADGSISTREYSLEDIKENWRAPSALSIPIDVQDGRAPKTLLLGVADPWDAWNLAGMDVLEADEDALAHSDGRILNAVFCALMIAPLLLSLILYFVLRIRFVLLHAAMVTSWIVIQFLFGGGGFELFPWLTLTSRSVIVHLMAAMNGAMLCLLIRELCEREKLGEDGRHLFKWTAVFMIVATGLMLVATNKPWLPVSGSFIFLVILCVSSLIAFVLIVRTAIRGSRMALALMLGTQGFSCLILAFVFMPHEATTGFFNYEILSYAAILWEVLIYCSIVGFKAVSLRREHDIAVLENSLLFKQASTDHLTGLLNRRAIVEEYTFLSRRGELKRHDWFMAVIDIDFFKSVNDTFGHDGGDICLKQLAAILQDRFSETGYCARIGGEEFLALFRAPGLKGAEKTAETMRGQIALYRFGAADEPIGGLTVSTGLLQVPSGELQTFDALYKAADSALYAAKAKGRNRVEIANLGRSWSADMAAPDASLDQDIGARYQNVSAN